MFESALNFRFSRCGPPTPQQISEASAVYAAKKLGQVNPEVVKYFVPFARVLLAKTTAEDVEEGGEVDSSGHLDVLLAKCLAAISNRNTIASR